MTLLTRFSLGNRALIALITLFIAVFGTFSVTQLKQELIPSIELPRLTVVTVMPGASPEVVDEQVSEPLARVIGELPEVEQAIATSSANMSIISIGFEYGIDVNEFTNTVDAVMEPVAEGFPQEAVPTVITGSTSDIPVIYLTASSADDDVAAITTDLQDVVVPALEDLDGVRAAQVSGGETQQVLITPIPQALAEHGLSPQDLTAVLDDNGITLPVGSVAGDGVTMPVQGGTPLTDLDDLRSLPLVTEQGAVVEFSEVATVEVVTEDPTSLTRMNGQTALSVSITASQGADVVAVSHAVSAELERLTGPGGSLPELTVTVVFDQAPFIEESISDLAIEGVLGLVFAVAVILVFLLSVRSTLVTAISIPLSVLVTFIGLHLGGYSLNMLTLGALTIAIGRVVDDSIVVIENIKRHLGYGQPKGRAILTAVREVAAAITASTLATVAVFVPIAVVGGMVGELFSPFALTVTIAMLSSLLVALTIVPVLSYWFIKTPRTGDTQPDPRQVRAAAEAKELASPLQRSYVPVLKASQRRPWVTVAASVVLLGLTVGLIPFMKVDFLGNPEQNMVMVSQEFDAGTDLDSLSEGIAPVEEALEELDGVVDVMVMAGTGGGNASSGGGMDFAAMLGGSGTATYIVNTDAHADQTALQERIRETLENLDPEEVPGEITLMDGGAMSGFGGAVEVKVFSRNDADLNDAAQQIYDAMADVPNTTGITTDLAPAQPTVQIQVNRTAALEAGYTELQLVGMVAGTLTPRSVGTISVEGEDHHIYLDSAAPPETVAQLRDMPIPTATGMVPLQELAEVEEVTVATTVVRQDRDQVATISLTPEEGQLGPVTADIEQRLADLDLPAGTTAAVGGLAEQQQEAFEQLGLAMLVAIAIVFLLLVLTFRSMMQPLILLVSIPFAATGALALLLITGRPLGVSALIGMLMLIGIVVTNAIVLIDLINQYRLQGLTLDDAIFHGARQRLRPILMTALATIFALIPMAFGFTGSSGFISQDLAIVVIGGLVSSTALTLVLIPSLYLLFERRQERRREATGEPGYGTGLQELSTHTGKHAIIRP